MHLYTGEEIGLKKNVIVASHNLMPPNHEYAKKLEWAINYVNGLSPDVDERINKYIISH